MSSTTDVTCKHCQSVRMNNEAKPSEAEAAKSELSVSVIHVENKQRREEDFDAVK